MNEEILNFYHLKSESGDDYYGVVKGDLNRREIRRAAIDKVTHDTDGCEDEDTLSLQGYSRYENRCNAAVVQSEVNKRIKALADWQREVCDILGYDSEIPGNVEELLTSLPACRAEAAADRDEVERLRDEIAGLREVIRGTQASIILLSGGEHQ